MRKDARELQEIISNAVRKETDLGDAAAYDIGFHMTDWLSDLEQLQRIFDAPTEFSSRQIYLVVLNFLLHAPEHIAEAAFLMTESRINYIFRSPGDGT